MYRSLARWSFQHGLFVLIAWIVALVVVNALAGVVGAGFSGEFSTPESESSTGFKVLNENFPGAGSAFGGSLVFIAEGGVDRPDVVAEMTAYFDAIDRIDGVSVVSPYEPLGQGQIAPGGGIAFAQLNLDRDVDQARAALIAEEVHTLEPSIDGVRTELGGAIFAEFEPPESELIGLAFAVVILIISFGSVMAMGLPIGVALAGVGTGGLGAVSLLSKAVSIPEFAPFIGIMIGLGVGIDYVLFMVTRYRELTRQGQIGRAHV